ncbi:MAG: pyrroline-5-carboxylate reductase [Pseudomonadota bacterium]
MDGGDLASIKRLSLLGCGKMGSALLAGWLAGGVPPARIDVQETAPSQWLLDQSATGVRLNAAVDEPTTVLVVAVKPQSMRDALGPFSRLGVGRTLVISIAAGTQIALFEEIFGSETPIIRAMPNTPAAVGQGITALIGNGAAQPNHLALAEALMGAVGAVVHLHDEEEMHAVTALSGSGPAYLFHMIEAMAAAGEAAGLSAGLSMQLARATIAGAGSLAQQSPEKAETLRVNVTSPGGTTAAGLDVLMPELPDLMRRTVAAAADRSRALG